MAIWSKQKKLETKNNLIDGKNYKKLVSYFLGFVHSKSIKMLSLYYYHELVGKTKENEENVSGSWRLHTE